MTHRIIAPADVATLGLTGCGGGAPASAPTVTMSSTVTDTVTSPPVTAIATPSAADRTLAAPVVTTRGPHDFG